MKWGAQETCRGSETILCNTGYKSLSALSKLMECTKNEP